MWPLAVLTGDRINRVFYKEMIVWPFCLAKKTAHNNEVAIRWGSTVCASCQRSMVPANAKR